MFAIIRFPPHFQSPPGRKELLGGKVAIGCPLILGKFVDTGLDERSVLFDCGSYDDLFRHIQIPLPLCSGHKRPLRRDNIPLLRAFYKWENPVSILLPGAVRFDEAERPPFHREFAEYLSLSWKKSGKIIRPGLYYRCGTTERRFFMLWGDHQVGHAIEITLERGKEVRKVPLSEAAGSGVSASFALLASEEGYRKYDFRFDAGKSRWSLQEVRWIFPGVKLPGRNDVLILPDRAGARWPHPAQLLFEELKSSVGSWRDRKVWLRESGLLPPEMKDAAENALEVRCSMPFFSYNSEKGTLSAFMLDPGFETSFLKISAQRDLPGVTLELSKRFDREVTRWNCTFAMGLHSGDWHRDARSYRAFYDTLGLGIRKAAPLGAGVHAHYDLRWQDGCIHHRYRDLAGLADDAKADGFDALVFGGWNEGGFDNNYPHFRPDPLLGTEKELIDAVKAIHGKKLKVLFYVNGHSYDRSTGDFDTAGAPCAIRLADGSTRDVRWGSRILTGMCMGSAAWRKTVNGNVDYVMHTLGADGVYLDQFNVIPPRCYASGHDHSRSATAGILAAFGEVRRTAGEDAVFITEHPLDALNACVDYQDLETVWNNQALTFPELFCYTFPEAGRMDLLVQKPWPCTDPEIEGRFLRRNFDRLLLTGTKLWCYDHASSARGFRAHFLAGQKLRNQFSVQFDSGLYRHIDHLSEIPAGVEAAWYDLPGQEAMIVIANTTGSPGTLTVDGTEKIEFSADALQVIELLRKGPPTREDSDKHEKCRSRKTSKTRCRSR